jgi:hypothetical protein
MEDNLMTGFKFFALATLAAMCFAVTASKTQAQVSVEVGAAPDCPYGYYDVAPYSCAPSGYYGPEWFNEGTFTGAGPWFHGPDNFRGNVDNRMDPQKGYKGPTPARGEKAEPSKRVDSAHFKGNEVRDGRGHVAAAKK